MKTRSFLILVLILSLSVLPSLQIAFGAASSSSSSSTSSTSTSTAAHSPYSERVDIYTAGSNGYWLVTLNPVNATKPAIVAAESVAGVSAYEVTAVQASTASASSQLFWSDGYGIVNLPFMPYAGIFLNVTASSQSEAASAASDFDSLFGASFSQISSGGGNYTFYSPGDFGIAGAAIFATAPTAYGGLASITTESSLASDPTPTAILTGVRNGSSFDHALRFGSTEPSAVGSNNSLLLENAMNLPNASYSSSPDATSSRFVVHSLDGLIRSSDNATVNDYVANFSSTYSASISPGTRFRPNMTITQNPPVLTATRSVDTGALASGGVVSVTLSFKNTASNGTIQNVSVNDSWWRSYPSLFSLSVGNASFTIPSLAPQQNVSRAYVLKLNSADSHNLFVPPVVASYQFNAGSVLVNATTSTNELEIRTNTPGPALEISAGSDIFSGSSLGKAGNYVVTVTNTGNQPALNLNVLNYSDPTLVAGDSWTIKVPLPFSSISDRNLTQSFTVGWTAPDGSTGTIVSNPATVILSHSSIQLPILQFKLTTAVTYDVLESGTINASYSLMNRGTAPADNVSVTQPFPPGMTCTAVLTGNGSCDASGFTLNLSSVAAFVNNSGILQLSFSKENYLTPAASVVSTRGGLTLRTSGSVIAVAAGLSVSKTFSPGVAFVGQESNATMSVSNGGSLPVYNLTLSTTADSFDTAVSGVLNREYTSLAPSASDSLSYTVKMAAPGNHTSASTSLSYIFGGQSVQYPVKSGAIMVYGPIKATTSTGSTPREGSNFPLSLSVQNQSPEDVSNVSFSFSVPPGLTVVSYSSDFTVSGRTVTLLVPSLAAGATSNNTVTLRATFDGDFTLASGNLTFDYQGATIPGLVSSPPISVGVDALLRYEVPIGVAVLLALVVAVYMHRKPLVPAR